MTRSASAGRTSPGRRRRRSTDGLGRERVEVVEVGDAGQDRDGDAEAGARRAARRRGRGRGRPRRGGGGRRRSAGRGRAGVQPVRAAISAMPSAKSAGSPRKRLTMKAFMSSASAGSRTARVPTRLAMTPPRSMSPISTTGTCAARAKPMLAMSPARRLTSEALPAPSTRTRSACAGEAAVAVEDGGEQGGLAGAGRRGRRRWRGRGRGATTWAPTALCGFRRTGFMSTVGGTRAARACRAWARPISPPSAVTAALFDMFCGLNGRTRRPRSAKARARPATISDLPTSEPVPWNMRLTAGMGFGLSSMVNARFVRCTLHAQRMHGTYARCARGPNALTRGARSRRGNRRVPRRCLRREYLGQEEGGGAAPRGGSGRGSKLDALLGLHAGGEVVFGLAHLGDEVGGGEEVGPGVAARSRRRAGRGGGRRGRRRRGEVEVVVAQRDVELVEDQERDRSGRPSAPRPAPSRARRRRCRGRGPGSPR